MPKPRFALSVGQYLRNGEYLVSPNRAFHAVQSNDGSLKVIRGPNPTNAYGVLWQLPARGIGKYLTIQQGDGNLCTYPTVDPALLQNPVWCHNKVWRGKPNQFFTIIQNDGNLCTYAGATPVDGMDPAVWQLGTSVFWCSGVTSPAPWMEGQKLVAASGPPLGTAVYYGAWPERLDSDQLLLWMRPDSEQRWVLGSDGTIRRAANRHQCLTLNSGYDYALSVGQCRRIQNSYADSNNRKQYYYTEFDGWDYCPADGSIRNRHLPKGCLMTNGTYDKPNESASFDRDFCVIDTKGPDAYGGAWTFQQWPQ